MSTPKKYGKYIKYSSLGFEMIGYILFGYLIGNYIDQKVASPKPYFTAALILLFLIAAFYRLIKRLEQDKKND